MFTCSSHFSSLNPSLHLLYRHRLSLQLNLAHPFPLTSPDPELNTWISIQTFSICRSCSSYSLSYYILRGKCMARSIINALSIRIRNLERNFNPVLYPSLLLSLYYYHPSLEPRSLKSCSFNSPSISYELCHRCGVGNRLYISAWLWPILSEVQTKVQAPVYGEISTRVMKAINLIMVIFSFWWVGNLGLN